MDEAIKVLEEHLWIGVFFSVVLLYLCIIFVKNAKDSVQGLRAILVGICLIAILSIWVVPCGLDFATKSIIQTSGTYRNVDMSKSNSGLAGIHSVTLETENNCTINLTTPIFSSNINFPTGTYEVVAYYSQRSKILLLIEIVYE